MKTKAIVFEKYGSPDVLQLKDVEKPTPKDNEVLVRVYAATVAAGDVKTRSLKLPLLFQLLLRILWGFRGPRKKILGHEFAGEIESVGKDVENWVNPAGSTLHLRVPSCCFCATRFINGLL